MFTKYVLLENALQVADIPLNMYMQVCNVQTNTAEFRFTYQILKIRAVASYPTPQVGQIENQLRPWQVPLLCSMKVVLLSLLLKVSCCGDTKNQMNCNAVKIRIETLPFMDLG